MRLGTAFLVCFGLAICLAEPGMGQRLEGCSEPGTLATALRTLRNSDWKDMSVARLQKLWPTRLRPLECDERSCSSIVDEGRIISGEFECGEVFDFKVTQKDDGTTGERLQSIVIHYTARTREESVSAAKTLAKAIGLNDPAAATVGRDKWQQFQWESNMFGRESSVLELQWARVGANWNLYFSFDRYPLGTTHGPNGR